MVRRPERMRAGAAGPPYSRARLTTNLLRFVRVTKYLIAGVTVTVFCVSWIASVNNSADNEWRGVRWGERKGGSGTLPTMKTIVAYSEGKQAEMDKPSPVACDRPPAFPKVPYINRTWSPEKQEESVWQLVEGTRVSLYAAFYDDRLPQRYVRILATFKGRDISKEAPLFCQTRVLNPFKDSVEVVAAKPLEIWYHAWDTTSLGLEMPILLSCPLTDSLYQPSVVSVVTQPCNDASNAFYIEPAGPINKRNFTICVKDMHFEKDISQSLVEWVETNKLLGVEKIDVYVGKLAKETEKVLMHYRDQGYVRLFNVPIKNNPHWDLWQNRKYHVITYNDCLYRNFRESEFIIPLDVDEIILPKIGDTLPELIKRLKISGWDPSQHTAILIRNVFFFSFMQGVDKYDQKKIQIKNEMYVKRDDVRIKKAENLVVGDLELVDDTNRNEVIDYNEVDKGLGDRYKSRCKGDLPIPKLVQYVVRSAVTSPVGHFCKSIMLTSKVLTAFNHYPLHSLSSHFLGSGRWPAPYSEVQLNHYKESCNTTLMPNCRQYGRRARLDHAALRLRSRLTNALADAPCATINVA